MKIKLFLMSACVLFLFACEKEETTVNVDLIGKWNVFETEVQVGDSVIVSPQGRGSNIFFIYYVENGIEFFEDQSFNMRIADEDGIFRTYDTLSRNQLTWEIEEDLIILKSIHDSVFSIDQKHELPFTLNNNILEFENGNAKYRLIKE